jgi:hypothetical protein
MKVWIIYSSYRKKMLETGDVHTAVFMVRGKKRQHPCDALKCGGKRISFSSSDPVMSLKDFKFECRKRARKRR